MSTTRLAGISPRHWMVVIGSGLLMSLNVLMFLAVGLLMPPLAVSFVPLLGMATATMPVGIAIGSPLWGVAKDANGERRSG